MTVRSVVKVCLYHQRGENLLLRVFAGMRGAFTASFRVLCRSRSYAKVGQELLYIAKAPQLKLGEDDFVQFPDVSHLTETFDKTQWKVR